MMERFMFNDAVVAWALLEALPGAGHTPGLTQQRAAVRSLIDSVLGPDVEIAHDAQGAPFAVDYQGFISISHCSRGVAIAWHPSRRVGVDIETERLQLMRVRHKYLSEREMQQCTSLPALLEAWTVKEALYKALLAPGTPLVDIPLEHPSYDILTTHPTSGVALTVVINKF